MKKKRIAAFLAALLMAIPFAALTACKKEETPPAPLLPDGIGVTEEWICAVMGKYSWPCAWRAL